MDQITHSVRTTQPAKIIRTFHERQQVNQLRNFWLKTESMKSYTHFKQRSIRNLLARATVKTFPATPPTGEVTFVEIPTYSEQPIECPHKAVASSEHPLMHTFYR